MHDVRTIKWFFRHGFTPCLDIKKALKAFDKIVPNSKKKIEH
jgi:hypothetical protein